MKFYLFIPALACCLCLAACNPQPANDRTPRPAGSQSVIDRYCQSPYDSSETIRGVIFVDSKQQIIFDYDSAGWSQKIVLLPCNDKLKNYVLSNYDAFINTRSHGRHQYISATGIFLTHHDKGVPRDTFLFYECAMPDSLP